YGFVRLAFTPLSLSPLAFRLSPAFLLVEDALGALLACLLGRVDHLVLGLEDSAQLIDDVYEALPLRHLVEDALHRRHDLALKLAGLLLMRSGVAPVGRHLG